ncbi:hypothetical protein, conserved [Plasmodium gonderi]|uniref:RRM domain-containing protein n=1 Tax=Plasmodium gonderi TaxID=77519 RepID=A0A1Y1JRG2_PLAGO|nr:hypothetical protein, conserved [Plasmodium gonderi]GAW83807.1 hypothetical protein, conserved [Plasmodium gonderi]
MRIFLIVVITSVLFSFPKKSTVNCYKIYGILKKFKRGKSIKSWKNTDEYKSEMNENNILLKGKKRYSFTPPKRNTVKDIKRRLRFNEKNVRLRNPKFVKKKNIHKSLIDDINKEILKENIKSIGTNNDSEGLAEHSVLPLPLDEKSSESYNCLILCKGLPFHVDSSKIKDFFKPYKIVDKYIIFIKDKKGNFFGDVIVRFLNKEQKILALKNKNFKFLMHRYIQLYNINEEHYEEYFNIGYKNPPSYKNYIPIKNVVVSSSLDGGDNSVGSVYNSSSLYNSNSYSDEEFQYHSFSDHHLDNDEDTIYLREKINKKGILLKSIYTGKKLKGRITSVHTYGVFVDCDVYIKMGNNRFIKLLALLHKNKLTINIGLPTDPLHEQEKKELILQKNMNIIVYVDKIIKREIATSASNNSSGKNNLIFFNLTFDSSITEEKIEWFQKMKLKKKTLEDKIKIYNDNFMSMNSNSFKASETSIPEFVQFGKQHPNGEEEPRGGAADRKNIIKVNHKEVNMQNGNSNEENNKMDESFVVRENILSTEQTNVKHKRKHNNRSNKIYLMKNRNNEYNYVQKKWYKCRVHEALSRLNSGMEESQFSEISANEKNSPKGGGKGENKTKKKGKKKKRKKYLDESSLYDDVDNFDEIFNLGVRDVEGNDEKSEDITIGSANETDAENVKNLTHLTHSADAEKMEDKHYDLHEPIESNRNKKIEKNVMDDYKNEVKSVLYDIFRENKNSRKVSKKFLPKEQIQESDGKISEKTHVHNYKEVLPSNKGILHKEENINNESVSGKCFENLSDRSKWKNDIRKEESLYYSKMFGIKSDVNDFYAVDTKSKEVDGIRKSLEGMEEFMDFSEKKMEEKECLSGFSVGSLRLGNFENSVESNKKEEKEGEEEEDEEQEEKHQSDAETGSCTNKEIHPNVDEKKETELDSIINTDDSETLDFSYLSEMSSDELKKEIYKKGFLLPIDTSMESLKSRLIQICICERRNEKFDNYPFVRYYLFDFDLPIEDVKSFVLANRKFLNKKNITKNFLNSLQLNELKYLLHKSMENIRLWEPEDNIKRKILNLNKDILQKQNLNHVDNIDEKNLLILWNDFKDFLLNCVYGNDGTNGTWGGEVFKNIETENNEHTKTSYGNINVNTRKYINRLKNMEKENFFLNKNQPFDDILGTQINKNKMEHKDPFENALSTLNKHLEENEHDLPDKINLKEAMKILNNRTYLKKIKRSFNNNTSDEKTNEDYIKKIIHLILKNKKYFKENLSEEILKRKPHEELIILLDQLPAEVIEDLL